MPVKVSTDIFDSDNESLPPCFRCQEKIKHGERHFHWGVQFDKEFVQCSFHRAPTKKLVGLTVLYSFGFQDTFETNQFIRISRVNRRGKILNPASPSYLTLSHIFELYENPSKELANKLVDENTQENHYWAEKAKEEIRTKEVTQGNDGIRRGARVLGLERYCSECGVSEAEMVSRNPKYTLCRGVCVVCYRKLFRKSSNPQR
jgi:hypothetical protein